MSELRITSFIARLYSQQQITSQVLRDQLNVFLSDGYATLVSFMNNVFFASDENLFHFLKNTIHQSSKTDDDMRKIIYQFLANYISQYSHRLIQYLTEMFKLVNNLFRLQHSAKPKQFSLIALATIIDTYDKAVLINQNVLSPDKLHQDLVYLLKTQKFTSGVKGQMWYLISTIQGKFLDTINTDRKKQVQQICLLQLKNLINENKNFTTISSILKSFQKSLEDCLLSHDDVKQLYKFISVLILPLSSRIQISLSAMQVLIKRSTLFQKFILDDGKKLFQNLCGLMNHTNRQFCYYLNDTMNQVIKQIVIGIQQNPDKYQKLYSIIIERSWSMLKQQTQYQISGSQGPKQKYKYNIISILNILGGISPLVKHFQTSQQLKKYFSFILNKCTRKLNKAFQYNPQKQLNDGIMPGEQQQLNAEKKQHIKYVLYNQKQLISFMSSLGQIINNLQVIQQSQVMQIQKIMLIGISNYPSFLPKYIPFLISSFVQLLKSLHSKTQFSFHLLLKKLFAQTFTILLNYKKYHIQNDQDYYRMVEKAVLFVKGLVEHETWTRGSLQQVAGGVFQYFQQMMLNLDLSYRSNVQVQFQENQSDFDKDIQLQNNQNYQDIIQIFFLSNQNIIMCNLNDYQFMCGLTLVYEGVLSQLNNYQYSSRIFQFYQKIVSRLRTFPKSIPLMKVIRALNAFIIAKNILVVQSESNRMQLQEQQVKSQRFSKGQVAQFKQLCSKLYNEIVCSHLQKHQQSCLFECLKMLVSFPCEVYLHQNSSILKSSLCSILFKCLNLGQQILSLANSSIQCIILIFSASKSLGQKYLIDCIVQMEKFICGQQREELERKIYLFLKERHVGRQGVRDRIMAFLGDVGGMVHLLVDNNTTNHATWALTCKVQLDLLMANTKYSINLMGVIDRMCFLALNGQNHLKKAACQFLHSVMTLIIGKAANKLSDSKQNTANFLQKILPCIFVISSTPSHPCQQLLHTLLIQSIRFFAHTQQPNSPDIQVILQHLLQQYTSTQDLSCLASKCLSQFIRYQIKSDSTKKASYPVIKVIMRNLWNLVSNRKARDGLVLLLVEMLREIHRENRLMKTYALEICSIIINVARLNSRIQHQVYYLAMKLVLAMSKVMKQLIIQNQRQGDRYKKFPTIHAYLNWIYTNCFFSFYSQQRHISFILWKQIITKYSQVLNYNCLSFLRDRANRDKKYLFSHLDQAIQSFQDEEFFNKNLAKVCGLAEVWGKLSYFQIMPTDKLIYFKDMEEIFMQSYINLIKFIIKSFKQKNYQIFLNNDIQKNYIHAILAFPVVLKQFSRINQHVGNTLKDNFIKLFNKNGLDVQTLINLLLKIVIKPSLLITNFNYDMMQDEKIEQSSVAKQRYKFSSSSSQLQQLNLNLQRSESFTHELLNFIFKLSQSSDSSLIQNFFFIIHQTYYCTEKDLVLFLFSQNQYNKETNQLNKRELNMFINVVKEISTYYQADNQRFANICKALITFIKQNWHLIQRENRTLIIQFILTFKNYTQTINFVIEVLLQVNMIFIKFQKYFINFIIHNFVRFANRFIELIRKQPQILKILYILNKKLKQKQLELFYQLIIRRLPQQIQLDEKNQQDCLKIHFICIQETKNIHLKVNYIEQMSKLVSKCMNICKQPQIHFLCINLSSVLLGRLHQTLSSAQYSSCTFKQIFDKCLSTLSTFYIPFTIGELLKEEEKQNCQKYLQAIRKLIVLSDDHYYLTYFFVGFRDQKMFGKLKKTYEHLINQIFSNYFALKNADQQFIILQWVLAFFENQLLDNKANVWHNLRALIIQNLFVKMVHFAKRQCLISLFMKYTQMLLRLINEQIRPQNVQQMIKQLQIKKCAFQILQHLYMYLPKPSKQKQYQTIHIHQHHKKIITRSVQILKKRFDTSSVILMSQYDRKRNQPKINKVMDLFRQYMAAAYNCLIVVFISTQSKVQHFRKYLFQKGEVFWEHLVDVDKIDYQFTIETDFHIMRPIQSISKYQFRSQKQLKQKIKNQYISSSLYVIEEQYAPEKQKQKINEIKQEPQENEQGQRMQIQEMAHIPKKQILNSPIQQDYINKHPSMINLLRVVDYLHEQFYDGKTPLWMKPVYEQLCSQSLPLSVRLLLTKLILNRPLIFSQFQMWGQCLLNYLTLKQTGGKYIHYYYRDVLLQLIQYIKKGFLPQVSKINQILSKIIKSLPHENNMIYSSNIDIMEELMKLVQGTYVDKGVLSKMLANKIQPGKVGQVKIQHAQVDQNKLESKETQKKDKNRFEWRMCACIVMKSCLIFRIPIMTEEQWKQGKANKKQHIFDFFNQTISNKYVKFIQELIFQNTKKYRVAASGLLGQWLKTFNQQNPSYMISPSNIDRLNNYIKQFLHSLYYRQQNRTAKQRFSLSFLNIASRWPAIINEHKLFGILDTIIVKYKSYEKVQILQSTISYVKYQDSHKNVGFIPQLMMTISSHVQKFFNDSLEVLEFSVRIIRALATTFFLDHKEIFQSFYQVFDKLVEGYSHSEHQIVQKQFYQFLLTIKDYLNSLNEESLRFKTFLSKQIVQNFKQKIQGSLIAGLGSQHNAVRKLILDHFEYYSNDSQTIESRVLNILKSIYIKEHQNLWLINAVPLIFSIAKKSSQYTNYLFSKPIEQSAKLYDWDFRNMKFQNSSLPYTPAYSFFPDDRPNKKIINKLGQASQGSSFIASLGSNRVGGILRATQDQYLSQEQQVFTMLASQNEDGSLQAFSQSQSISLQKQENQKIQDDERNYAALNNIFMSNKRSKTKLQSMSKKPMKALQQGVKIINDKIRFKPKSSNAFIQKRIRSSQPKAGAPSINSSYRSYKLGQLPNIQISICHIIEPLIQVCCFDKELASQLFTIFFMEFVRDNEQARNSIKDLLIWLISKDTNTFDFSFISTIQKCLIMLCSEGNDVNISMKDIALASNTVDYAIVFTQQSLIRLSLQKICNKKIILQQSSSISTQWLDLIDLYQSISQHSFLPPLLKKICLPNQYTSLMKLLSLKEDGNIVQCKNQLENLIRITANVRLEGFLLREKVDCQGLLGDWDKVGDELQPKLLDLTITHQQSRILTLSLLNSQKQQKRLDLLHMIKFPQHEYEYQKSLLALCDYNFDKASYEIQKNLSQFSVAYNKTTSFSSTSKHLLLSQMQKSFQLKQFLTIIGHREISLSSILAQLQKWTTRQPNQMFDSNLVWIEIMESRLFYTRVFYRRFGLEKNAVAKVNTDYMVQVVNQMLRTGVHTYAESLTKKALLHMRQSGFFNWKFYESISSLRLVQLKKKNTINIKSYQFVPKLVLKQLTDSNQLDCYSDIKYLFIENQHTQGFLECCIKATSCQVKPSVMQMVDKTNRIYLNYDRIKKDFKTLEKQNRLDKAELEQLQCKIHFDFSMFLQRVLQLTKGKFQIKQISQMMQKSHLSAQRLVQIYVLQLIETISLINSGSSSSKQSSKRLGSLVQGQKQASSSMNQRQSSSQKVFSMVLKLLKTVQSQNSSVGYLFSQAINDKKLPTWIFLYFIPQIIKSLNSYQHYHHFEDLFDIILKLYPQALVYHFNCSYQKEDQCLTSLSKLIYNTLRQKLKINFSFIHALEMLHHPEMRLREILNRFSIPGEDQTVLKELQTFANVQPKLLGKYNRKFILDHRKVIHTIINLKKEQKSKTQANTYIQKLMKQLDPKLKQNQQKMKNFTKTSDGSIFFQDYNSSDMARLQVPATSYCKFQQPLKWSKVFIQSFDLSLVTLNSIRKPKRLTLYGSNQKKYMFLVKGGEDVRLDQRIQELFNLVNRVLKDDPKCSKRALEIKRFQVIPIKKMLGVFQWVDQSQTLRSVLQRELFETNPNLNLAQNNPAYKYYSNTLQKCSRNKQVSAIYKNFLDLPNSQIISNIQTCQSLLPYGLLRKSLQRLSKSYDYYLHIKNQFISNYAIVCVVGYILGIGDRHLDNFLIHAPTLNVVMIDFGYSFGAGRELAVPELIPFRLTKCFTQLMQPIGYQGVFKQTMINTFQALQNKINLIVDYCDVFIDDPLMQWVWKCRRQMSTFQSDHISMTISQQPPQKRKYSKKIQYVQKKLMGQHPRRILVQQLQQSRHKQSVFYDRVKQAIWQGSKTDLMRRNKLLPANQVVEELINLASDKIILGRSFIGLNPFV